MTDDPKHRAMQLELLEIALTATSEGEQMTDAAACLTRYGRAVPELEAEAQAVIDAQENVGEMGSAGEHELG